MRTTTSKAYIIISWVLAVFWLAGLILALNKTDVSAGALILYLFADVCFFASAIMSTSRYRREKRQPTLYDLVGLDAIVAVYSDWGIGCDGTQPVVVKADRQHFREVTGDAAVIVGRKTLADFPGGQPLKGRRNIVLTRQELDIPGAETAKSVEEALTLVKDEAQVFVIGGASVYEAMMPYIRRVYVTKIGAAPASDAFFPDLDKQSDWTITERSGQMQQDELTYEFLTYERK